MYNPNIPNVQHQLRQGKSFTVNCVRQLGAREGEGARRGVTAGSLGLNS